MTLKGKQNHYNVKFLKDKIFNQGKRFKDCFEELF